MPNEHEFSLAVLREILSQPTAPYHEQRVAACVCAYLREWGISFSTDETGNIIARYKRGPACRPLLLMAHMDHPAFSIVEGGGVDWTAALEGWVAPRYFDVPVAVRVYPRAAGASAGGVGATINGYTAGGGLGEARLRLTLADQQAATLLQPGDFGIWDLPDFEVRDGFVHARAIDDLVGCASMLLTLWEASREGWDTDLYAIFTRAEEVGLVGAYAVLQSGALPRDGYVVSLEASPALPGAVQGEGPVVRVGDRVTTFSQDAELVLKAAAHQIGSAIWQPSPDLPRASGGPKVQRQLMSGGSCEGSMAVQLGYSTAGMAIPLGNYHNMGEGSVLAPENIHLDDFLTGVRLLRAAARLLPEADRVRAEHRVAHVPRAEQLARLKEQR